MARNDWGEQWEGEEREEKRTGSAAYEEYLRAFTWQRPNPSYVYDPQSRRDRRVYVCGMCHDTGSIAYFDADPQDTDALVFGAKRGEEYPRHKISACPKCRPRTIDFIYLGLPANQVQYAIEGRQHLRSERGRAQLRAYLAWWETAENERKRLRREELRRMTGGIGKPMPRALVGIGEELGAGGNYEEAEQ